MFFFAKYSIHLDLKFTTVSKWPIQKKFELIAKKYLILLKHFFVPFVLGKNSLNLFGRTVFYGTKFGISDYQGILAHHQKLIIGSNLKIPSKPTIVDIGASFG